MWFSSICLPGNSSRTPLFSLSHISILIEGRAGVDFFRHSIPECGDLVAQTQPWSGVALRGRDVKARLTRRDGAEYPTGPHLSKLEIRRSVTGRDNWPTVVGVEP